MHWLTASAKILLDAGDVDLAVSLNEGVPPFFALIAVADLEAAELAFAEEGFAFVQADVLWCDITGSGFGHDSEHVGAGFQVGEKGADGLLVENALLEFGEFGCVAHFFGIINIALVGAGQTSWQILHPVQWSGTMRGMPRSVRMAPLSGQCSLQTEQKLFW